MACTISAGMVSELGQAKLSWHSPAVALLNFRNASRAPPYGQTSLLKGSWMVIHNTFLYMHHLVVLLLYLKTNTSLQHKKLRPAIFKFRRKCDSQGNCDFQYHVMVKVMFLSLQSYSFSMTCFSTTHFLALSKKMP